VVVTIDTPLAAKDSAEVKAEAVILGVPPLVSVVGDKRFVYSVLVGLARGYLINGCYGYAG